MWCRVYAQRACLPTCTVLTYVRAKHPACARGRSFSRRRMLFGAMCWGFRDSHPWACFRSEFIRHCRFGVFQYVVAKVVVTLLTLIFVVRGRWQTGPPRPC